MSTLTLDTPIGGISADLLCVTAADLVAGDLIGGERWQRVTAVVAYEGADGPVVSAVVEDLDYAHPRTTHMEAGARVAVLRTGGAL